MAIIESIILDFGGVIYHIDPLRQLKAFLSLRIEEFDKKYQSLINTSLFEDLETGRINETAFFNEISAISGNRKISMEEWIKAWNSILVGYDVSAVELITKLKFRYRLFLLSNTNAIHYRAFTREFRNQFGYELETLFEKVFWSFQTGQRKPFPATYQYVLENAGINATQSVFIDDTLVNVEQAKKAGLPSIYLSHRRELTDIFNDKLELSGF